MAEIADQEILREVPPQQRLHNNNPPRLSQEFREHLRELRKEECLFPHVFVDRDWKQNKKGTSILPLTATDIFKTWNEGASLVSSYYDQPGLEQRVVHNYHLKTLAISAKQVSLTNANGSLSEEESPLKEKLKGAMNIVQFDQLMLEELRQRCFERLGQSVNEP